MFSQRHLGRHYLGYGQRQAVGRDQKNDIVDLVGRRIVAVSLIPDDIGIPMMRLIIDAAARMPPCIIKLELFELFLFPIVLPYSITTSSA